jgi:hypothetical protein
MARAQKQLHNVYYTIPSGTYYGTPAIDLRLIEPVSLVIPSVWTAADITFSGSPDGELLNYGWLSSPTGKIIKVPQAIAYRSYRLTASWFEGVNFLFIVSGDLGVGLAGVVNQAADRTLLLVCRDRYAEVAPE